MTAGMHSANLANKILAWLSGTSMGTPPTALYFKLHTGDPGSAGTANASANTTRPAATWASPSGGSMSANGTLPSWGTWASGSETLTHTSVWDASTAGNFLWSFPLASSVAVVNGNVVAFTALSLALTPIAA